ncbi:MAG: tRNA pseudouridine(13) synthase TruD [Gammaproteobacteria bacterium]|nr:tRNA pseudouridine(13) synthase TruD [Gammaproteobacteria bacterium]
MFAVAAADAELAARAERLEIHPTGPLWGEGRPQTLGAVLALESEAALSLPTESALCVAAGMRQERRSLRLRAQDLRCEAEERGVVLSFGLTRGGFATAVLRELIAADIDGGGARAPSE